MNKPSLTTESLVSALLAFYYRLRYRNLTLEPGIRIAGKIQLSGSVKVHICSGTRIRKNNRFFGEGQVTVGQDCLLNGCIVACYEKITIEDRCLIGDCYLVDTDFHNVEPEARHFPLQAGSNRPILIQENAWIGSGAKILKGVTVGRNSVVGLGCIVRRKVPDNVIVIGNPEQIVKHFVPANVPH